VGSTSHPRVRLNKLCKMAGFVYAAVSHQWRFWSFKPAKPINVTNSIRSLRLAGGEMSQAELAGHVGVNHRSSPSRKAGTPVV